MNFDYNETKVCKKCGRELPIDKFGINHNYTRSMCKECFNEGMREKRYQQRLSDSIETYHKDKCNYAPYDKRLYISKLEFFQHILEGSKSMSKLQHLFKVGQNVKCSIDGTMQKL